MKLKCIGDRRRKMATVIWVNNLDTPVCILHNANTLKKGMNPAILPLTMGK